VSPRDPEGLRERARRWKSTSGPSLNGEAGHRNVFGITRRRVRFMPHRVEFLSTNIDTYVTSAQLGSEVEIGNRGLCGREGDYYV